MNQPPNALLPGSGGSYRPPALTPSITQDNRAPYVTRAEAWLVLRRVAPGDERVYLNAEAARLLPDGTSKAEIRHPVRQRDSWHLLIGSEARCALHPVGGTGGLWFRAPVAVRALFAAFGPEATTLHFRCWPVAGGLYRLKCATDNN